MTDHTPTPWRAIDNRIASDAYVLLGAPIATVHARKQPGMQKANAAFITQACNAHNELVKAAAEAKSLLNAIVNSDEPPNDQQMLDARALIGSLNFVLAKAGAL